MGELKLKFGCDECDQRLLVPARAIGRESPCPKCKKTLVVPRAYTKRVVKLYCSCGETHKSGTAICKTCGLDLWTSMAEIAQKNSGEEIPDEALGPREVPAGRRWADGVRVKFTCDCGKRLRVPVSKAGHKVTCTQCNEKIVAPASDAPATQLVLCACGAPISEADADGVCSRCEQHVHLPLDAPPAAATQGSEPVAAASEPCAEASEGAPERPPASGAGGDTAQLPAVSDSGGGTQPIEAEEAPVAPPMSEWPRTYADETRIKWACECGKKLRVPIGKAKKHKVPCSGCGEKIDAPLPGDERILAISCACGELVDPARPECADCGVVVFSFDRQEPEPPPAAAPPASEGRRETGRRRITTRTRTGTSRGGRELPPPPGASGPADKAKMAYHISMSVFFLSLTIYFWTEILTPNGPPPAVAASSPPAASSEPASQPVSLATSSIARASRAASSESKTWHDPNAGVGKANPGESRPPIDVASRSSEPDVSSATASSAEVASREAPTSSATQSSAAQSSADPTKGLLAAMNRPYLISQRGTFPRAPMPVPPLRESSGPVGEPNYDFFKAEVMPILETGCLKCHNVDIPFPTNFKLKTGRTSAKSNFKQVVALIDRGKPARSVLIRKALHRADGGVPHEGGNTWRKDNPAYQTMLAFVSGAQQGAPTAAPSGPARGVTGQALSFDGGGSTDPKNLRLSYRWRLAAAPKDSTAELESASSDKPTLTPDKPGHYALELIVTNTKKATSAPTLHHVDVRYSDDLVTTRPPTGAELEHKRAALAKLYRQLPRRALTEAERARVLATPLRKHVWELFRERAVWANWLRTEADNLSLTGSYAPASRAFQAMPSELANGRLMVRDAIRRLLTGPDFHRRYPTPASKARVILWRLLGYDPDDDANSELLANATTMASGKNARLFGVRGGNLDALARLATGEERFYSILLERYHRALRGEPADAEKLSAWIDRVRGKGADFEQVLADWISAPGYAD